MHTAVTSKPSTSAARVKKTTAPFREGVIIGIIIVISLYLLINVAYTQVIG
ncbi:MAG: hypothetical protein IPP73_17385 [Chitinophagaceae bacterium]|nr:hypothetical protein [Chitinophagaceae bacterium]